MLLLLCIMLDSDPDRRGRTSVCRSITPFLDQQKKRNLRSRCLRLLTVYRLGENAVSHSVPVLGPGNALVW